MYDVIVNHEIRLPVPRDCVLEVQVYFRVQHQVDLDITYVRIAHNVDISSRKEKGYRLQNGRVAPTYVSCWTQSVPETC